MTDNYEPIPFMGLVNLDLDRFVEETYGKNQENMPKYIVLGDGSLYIFHKEEDRYALCQQTPSLQEGISAAASEGGETDPQCTGESTLRSRQDGHGQE